MVTRLRAVGSAAAVALLVAACSTPPGETSQPAAQPADPVASAPASVSPISINEEMVALVDHAGHELWDVEKAAAKATIDWANVEHHAAQLAAAGLLIRTAGPGANDRDWVGSSGWQKWARAMSDAGMAARKAAQDKNRESLVAANGQLVESCEGCHKEFKPDLPSEGLTHMHSH